MSHNPMSDNRQFAQLKMGTRKHPKDFGRNITNIIGNQQSDDEGSYVIVCVLNLNMVNLRYRSARPEN